MWIGGKRDKVGGSVGEMVGVGGGDSVSRGHRH